MSWQGQILRVNLTEGTCEAEPLNTKWAQEYLGTRGLATKYLWENMSPTADPMSPENVLIFATGPLTGTMASTSGRYAVVTKGPLTGAIACSNSGGKFGAELKYAGYDLLLIEGRSEVPVYLLIQDERVTLEPANEVWGTTVWNTEDWIRNRHSNPQLKVATIGVAGEQGVRYAAVINDLHRAAGRSGVGAVMGSKNLKAIAARGTRGVSVKDPVRFMEAVNHGKKILVESSGRAYSRNSADCLPGTSKKYSSKGPIRLMPPLCRKLLKMAIGILLRIRHVSGAQSHVGGLRIFGKIILRLLIAKSIGMRQAGLSMKRPLP